ncbi:MAG: YihA family ribosome biogenesis GTP-binding protein, partial [Flavobacteriales bacterium]
REKWQTMILNYLTSRDNLICTMVLIDIRIPPQKIDLEFIEMLGDEGLPFAIVFTKADKEKPGAVERSVKAFSAELFKLFESLPNMIVTSSSTRLGREALLGLLQEGMTAH